MLTTHMLTTAQDLTSHQTLHLESNTLLQTVSYIERI